MKKKKESLVVDKWKPINIDKIIKKALSKK